MPAWYWSVALIGWTIFAAAPFFTAFFDPDVERRLAQIILGVGIVTAGWGFWVCPFLDTRNPSPKWRYEPKLRMRNLRMMFFAPAAIAAVCWLMTSLTIIEQYRALNQWQYDITHVLWLVLIAGLGPMVFLALYLTKVCEKRLADACFKRHVCFCCGYDLAGNPDARSCPECGAGIPHHVLPIFKRRAKETLRYRDLVRELELRGIHVRPHENVVIAG